MSEIRKTVAPWGSTMVGTEGKKRTSWFLRSFRLPENALAGPKSVWYFPNY